MSTIRPSCMTTILSAKARIASRWVMMITVRSDDELFQHLLNGLFAFQVHLAGGLVQDQDRRIAEYGPGKCDPLPLPARKPIAQCAGQGFVALRKFVFDEPVGMGLFGGLDHLLARGIGHAVTDVIEDRVVEQRRFLGYKPDLAAQILYPHVGQSHAVQADFAGRGIGESGYQMRKRAFSRSVRAHDGYRFAEADVQIHFLQHVFPGL